MHASPKANNDRFQVDVSRISEGQFASLDTPSARRRLLLLRDYDGVLHVYLLPLLDGKIALPDVHWFRPAGALCADFGPDTEGTKLARRGFIRCHNKLPLDWDAEWRWTYQGANTGKYTDDMPVAQYEIRGDDLYINRLY